MSRKRSLIIMFFLIFLSSITYATEYDIGGGNNDFSTLTELAGSISLYAGDIINVYPGTYTDEPTIGTSPRVVQGTENNPVLIRGVNNDGSAYIGLRSPVIFDFENGTLKTEGLISFTENTAWVEWQGFTIKNLKIGSGSNRVILFGGHGISKLKYTYFLNNIHTVSGGYGSDGLLIQYCEFAGGYSGDLIGTHPHAIYSFSGNLTIENSYFHDYIGSPTGGSQLIKSRDKSTTLKYNYFEASDNLDSIIDCAQTETDYSHYTGPQPCTLVGNVLLIPKDVNGVRSFITHANDKHYSGVNIRGAGGNLIIINNIFINLGSFDTRVFTSELASGDISEISNNIFYGIDHMQHPDYPFNMTGMNNWIPIGTNLYNGNGEITGLTNTIYGIDPGFVDLERLNFNLLPNSSCVNTGTNSITIIPKYQYLDDANKIERPVIGTIDIGAFEFNGDAPIYLCTDADTNNDGIVSNSELLVSINSWKNGDLTIKDLFDIINIWKNGCL